MKKTLYIFLLFAFLSLVPIVLAASSTTSQGLNNINDCPDFAYFVPDDAVAWAAWIGDNVAFDADEREGTCFVRFWKDAPVDTGYLILRNNSGNGGYNYLSVESGDDFEGGLPINFEDINDGSNWFSSDEIQDLATADNASSSLYWHNGTTWVFSNNLEEIARDAAIQEDLQDNDCSNGFESSFDVYVASTTDAFYGDCSGITPSSLLKEGEYTAGSPTGSETLTFNYPKDYVSPNPIGVFKYFELVYNNLNPFNVYTFCVDYGTASSTIDAYNGGFGSGWSTDQTACVTNLNPQEGLNVEYVPTGFFTPYRITSTSTEYYWKGFLFDGYTSADELLASTTISYAYTFDLDEEAQIDNTPYFIQQAIPGSIGQLGEDEYFWKTRLQTKAPFSYFYDIKDMWDNVSQPTASSFPVVSLDFTSSSIPFSVTVYSSSTLLQFFGSDNWTTAKQLIVASMWLMFFFYIFNRAKTLFNR